MPTPTPMSMSMLPPAMNEAGSIFQQPQQPQGSNFQNVFDARVRYPTDGNVARRDAETTARDAAGALAPFDGAAHGGKGGTGGDTHARGRRDSRLDGRAQNRSPGARGGAEAGGAAGETGRDTQATSCVDKASPDAFDGAEGVGGYS